MKVKEGENEGDNGHVHGYFVLACKYIYSAVVFLYLGEMSHSQFSEDGKG